MTEREWHIVNSDDIHGDVSRSLSLFLESFKSPDDDPLWSAAYYQWKVKANPAGKSFVNLAMNGNGIIGSASMIAKRFYCNGQELPWVELGDCYTHPQFQRRGILAALINDMKERIFTSGVAMMYGLPTEQARRVEEKHCHFRTHALLEIANGISGFNVLAMALKLKQKVWGPRRLLQAVLWIFNLPFLCVAGFWNTVAKAMSLTVEEVKIISSEYDTLWLQCRTAYDIALVRDAAYLHFRYFSHPLARYSFFEARHKGRLLGYMVLRFQKVRGFQKAIVADWLYNHKEPLVFLALLNTTMKYAMHMGVEFVTTWINAKGAEKWLFLISGFLPRKRQPVIVHEAPAHRSVLDGTKRWHFTIGDSDNA